MRTAILGVGVGLFVVAAASTASTQDAVPNTRVNGSFGPAIQFDTRGVEFGPWIRQFVPQIKRHWFIPCAAATESGHTVVTFNIQKDGTITNVDVRTPSRVRVFNENAQMAILASSPTAPLPSAYPAPEAFFTLTFYYNELPPGSSPSAATPLNPRPVEDFACALVGVNASEVERRLGKPAYVDGLRWTYTTARGTFAVYFDDAHVVIDVQPPGFDLAIFKK
jgi:TonB family protein